MLKFKKMHKDFRTMDINAILSIDCLRQTTIENIVKHNKNMDRDELIRILNNNIHVILCNMIKEVGDKNVK